MIFLMINLMIGLTNFIIMKNQTKDRDIFKCIQQLAEILESIKEEKNRRLFIKVISFFLKIPPFIGLMFIFILLSLPIFNICCLYYLIKSLKKSKVEEQ